MPYGEPPPGRSQPKWRHARLAGEHATARRRKDTGRYGSLLAKVDGAIAVVEDHDLIEGVTGVGVYVLMRPLPPKRQAVIRALVEAAAGDPPFHVPPHRVPSDWSLPAGYADCGLAHGAAGPLALLAQHREGRAGVPARTQARIGGWQVGAAY